MKYDSETCATAGELRGFGIEIPREVPDAAWIARSAVLLTTPEVRPHKIIRTKLVVRLNAKFRKPFTWLDVATGEEQQAHVNPV